MEGTSGAADAAPLRGGTVEAALEACSAFPRNTPGDFANGHSKPKPMASETPVTGAREHRDRRCASRSGWGEASGASDRVGRCRANEGFTPPARPLARDISAGSARRGHPRSVPLPQGSGSKNSCALGRPRVWCAGFERSGGGARGSWSGCRSRQAVCGPSRLEAKSSESGAGSSCSGESRGQ
jgi:hypothetical protein